MTNERTNICVGGLLPYRWKLYLQIYPDPVHETKEGARSGTRNNKPKVSQSSERMTYHLDACATPKRDYSHCSRRDDSTDSVTLHLGLFPLAFWPDDSLYSFLLLSFLRSFQIQEWRRFGNYQTKEKYATCTSLKQWVGILLMPKTDRAHKNYPTPEMWEETHLREIFCGTLTFNKAVWFV